MSWNDLVSGASDVVLSTFGVPGVYHSLLEGDVDTEIIIDRDVQVEDEGGAFTRRAMATLKSGLLTPKSNDWLEVGDNRWTVEAVESDDGHTLSLWIRPDL